MLFKSARLSGENDLLLCCARTHVNAEQAERIRSLAREQVDWESLIRTAGCHGVLPLVYQSLSAICPEALPRDIFSQLRRYFSVHDFNNRFMTKELLKVLDLFLARGIPAMPYKGPFLAATAYGSPSLRQFGDLDIVVRKRDLSNAKNLLISQGYRLASPLTPTEEAGHLQVAHAYSFVRDDDKVHIDLHWRFAQSFYSFPLDPEELWERLKPVPFDGAIVLAPPVEDQLLLLCVHGTRDGWRRLLLICDLAELISRNPGLDWKRLMDQATKVQSGRKLLLGLVLANDLLGAALPEEILAKANADPVVKSLARHMRERFFLDDEQMAKNIDTIAFHLRVMERLRDKSAYFLYCFWRTITPNTEDLAVLRLPAFLYFLYYPLRPFRLIRDYGLGSLRPILKHLTGA